MAKQTDNSLNTVNLIASTTQLTGDVNSQTDIRIDGTLKGNLNTGGRLIIGESGKILGDINCKTAEIEGSIEGTIVVAGLLTLKSTSMLKGEVTTAQLMIEPGAQFNGSCKMERTTEKDAK